MGCESSNEEPKASSKLPACISQGLTWTPKVCNIMAFMALIMGLGLLFYILLGLR